MIRIDGAFGEGGGQILRTSLSLSLATGQPFVMERIRAGRKRPGLLRQHLTAVLAAAEISGAEVEGADLESPRIAFTPGPVRPGEYRFSVGTAGSSTLVFQTIVPALMVANGSSRVLLEGGTHNMAAPPFDFLAQTFAPLVQRMGPKFHFGLERYGFYPAGGGRFKVEIDPTERLAPLHLGPRGEVTDRRIVAIVANLPRHIATRETEAAGSILNWGAECFAVEATRNSIGPGNILMIEITSPEVREIFTAFGQLGVSAEQVAATAAERVQQYLGSGAVAGEHLADQLLVPVALAGEGSFTAQTISLHTRTNMDVISQFLPVRFELQESDNYVTVRLHRTA